ncbi:hypothetical protein SSX86_001279 [Deinandra increscens subsp. villosa]|uniref:Small auxin up regulated protein n=1 Tax=Deinandra increscens subsp. villosa TaxID=3103831 RepID=A0AAP0HCE8_9ASTR
MKQIQGFRIRQKLVKPIKWAFHENQTYPSNYTKLKPTSCTDHKPITRLCKFGRRFTRFTRTVKDLFFSKPGYSRIGREEKPHVPRGHLAVYFGEEEDEVRRVLVPVIYLNHPVFGELLREAERVYGYNHRGGIHVPCRLSEFEDVQTRICAGAGGCGGYGGGGCKL